MIISWVEIARSRARTGPIPGPGVSDTETMTRRVTIVSLVLQVTWAHSGYWWMGQSGLFGGPENLESSGTGGYAGVSSVDNVVENVEAFEKPEKLQLQLPQARPLEVMLDMATRIMATKRPRVRRLKHHGGPKGPW